MTPKLQLRHVLSLIHRFEKDNRALHPLTNHRYLLYEHANERDHLKKPDAQFLLDYLD